MASPLNAYEVLGLSPGASKDAIRTRYRELAARYHPDRHAGNPLAELAQEKLRDINWAYQSLVASEQSRSAAPAATARGIRTASSGEIGARLKRLIVVAVCGLILVRFAPLIANVLFAIARILVKLGTALASAAREAPLVAFVLGVLALVAVFVVSRRRSTN